VIEGLTSTPKYLLSKYLYDEIGDRLFQKIMELEEYYLTSCELEIFSTYKDEMLDFFSSNCDLFHLIEFGAGNAFKTKVLIQRLVERNMAYEYNPIDISKNVIDSLTRDLRNLYPGMQLSPINKEYYSAVEEMSSRDTCKKVILFLGSNIGNFTSDEAHDFFGTLAQKMSPGDQLMTGFDLKKDPGIILAAYNDCKGVTRDFNLNLLHRIRRELNSDIDPAQFYHYPVYDPVEGKAKSYLVSKLDQEAIIGNSPVSIRFEKGEPIFMEISQKYDMAEIEEYSERAGFRILENFYDRKGYFVNSLWEFI
jgi:dimethylhistidine N-methyltransferase